MSMEATDQSRAIVKTGMIDTVTLDRLVKRYVSESHLSDSTHAAMFVAMYGDTVRYCSSWKRWLIWDGHTWRPDGRKEIYSLGLAYLRRLLAYVCRDPELKREAFDLITPLWRYESFQRRKSLIACATMERDSWVSPDELDRDPFLLNVQNGTVNLRTGELGESLQENFITKCASVDYCASASHEEWDRFLYRIMDGNVEMILYLQKAVGWALTADMSEQVLFILHGAGANGKSTFINIITEILGEYAMTSSVDTFMKKNSAGMSNDLARLRGCRFVSTSEVEAGRSLSEPLIKQVTGQDPLTARFLYGEFFEFRPSFKIFMATNHKPVLRGSDHGIWRRIRLLPFTVTIPYEERDVHLMEKLRKEKSGILNWMIEGCLLWQRERLGIPKEIRAATDAYQEEMDVTGSFFAECCEINKDDKKLMTAAKELYAVYAEWCVRNGEVPDSQTTFGGQLESLGFEKYRTSVARFWRGVGLKGV